MPIEHTNYLITSIMTLLNYNESTYVQENPDVAQAVASGVIPNGFEHWVKFGFFEKRTPQTSFNEQIYLDFNPEVAAAVANGSFSSGFEHYARFGAAEVRPLPVPQYLNFKKS